MSGSLETRLAEIENNIAALEGAEPTSRPIGEAPITLLQVKRETDLLWQSVRGIQEDIGEIKSALAKLQR
ncbi:hypothetical protein M3484_20925 [Pseudomonas sp. GX19020]|uniref:hypothetical protein n=1 Tax=Pseudomonas sp. GX19020 TaxID=2942277 RepID=UPI0020187A11|nr:hypothetical protein [Pseudomonas sp. GX19020]MCL4069025.1 hypothetical protein [Pseudomonas sp. GX19020]